MNAPTLHQIDSRITEINTSYQKQIDTLAIQVFETIVLSFCKKNKLRFIVSVGTWYFLEDDNSERKICTKGYGLNVNPTTWYGDRLKELERIREILNLIIDGESLGDYLPEYRGESK